MLEPPCPAGQLPGQCPARCWSSAYRGREKPGAMRHPPHCSQSTWSTGSHPHPGPLLQQMGREVQALRARPSHRHCRCSLGDHTPRAAPRQPPLQALRTLIARQGVHAWVCVLVGQATDGEINKKRDRVQHYAEKHNGTMGRGLLQTSPSRATSGTSETGWVCAECTLDFEYLLRTKECKLLFYNFYIDSRFK